MARRKRWTRGRIKKLNKEDQVAKKERKDGKE